MIFRRRSALGRRAVPFAVVTALAVSTPIAALAADGDDFVARDDYEKMSVARIEGELAKVRSAAGDAEVMVQKLSEEVAVAQDELSQAREESKDAKAAAEQSRAEYEKEREKLASLAQTVYRSGGSSLDALAPFLESDGLSDVTRRARVVESFSERANIDMQRVAALDHVAAAMEEQAQEAEERVSAAAKEVEKRAKDAQEQADAARAKVADVESHKEKLIAELAHRRQVTVEAERQRQEKIEADQRARVEAAERARVENAQSSVDKAEAERQRELANRESAASREQQRQNEEVQRKAAERAKEEARKQAEAEAARQAAEAARRAEAERQRAEEERRRAEEAARQKAAAGSTVGASALAWASGRVGAPYVWGGVGPGYDCSGLVMVAFAQYGVNLSHSAQAQYWASTRVPISDLRPGDLVFYGPGGSASGIYHVAFYAGNGQILEATYPGDIVRYNPLRYADLVPYGGRF